MKTFRRLLLLGSAVALVLYIAHNPAKAEVVLVGAFDLLTAAVRWVVAQPGRWLS